MDQVLTARKMPCLEKIVMHGKKCDPYLLRSWIRAALERNANELDVEFEGLCVYISCELTPSLFSRNKLVILKLCVDMTLNFQANSCWFPNLKVLQLDSIIYSDDDSLPNLLSGCPILEDLVIIRGKEDNLGTLNLVSRSVKRLKVDNVACCNHEEGVLHEMVFDTPAVESLEIACIRAKKIVVKDMLLIVDATFDCVALQPFCNSCNLLRGVSNVKYLSLDCSATETIELSSSYDLPFFCSLTRLEMNGYRFEEGNQGTISPWEFLLEILKCSPMLQYLKYETYRESSQEYNKASDWDVPNCLVTSLKSI